MVDRLVEKNQSNNQQIQKLRKQRIDNGDCPYCGNPNLTGGYLCIVCKERARNYQRAFRLTDKSKEYNRQYRKKLSYKEQKRNYQKRRRLTDVNFKLVWLLRNRLNSALKRNFKTGSAIRDLGCSINRLRKHLEDQFTPGMSWENHGTGKDKWNIDHIVPFALVDLAKRQDILRVCHYSNLRPMWQSENIRRQFSENQVRGEMP